MKTATPPSLRKIAEETGFSLSTVSRALRNSALIPEKTRLLILKSAKALGYQKNSEVNKLMSFLRKGKIQSIQATLAYFICHRPSTKPLDVSPSFNEYYEGVKKRAEECGYRLEIFWKNDPKISFARMEQILKSRGIQGIVIGPRPSYLSHVRVKWNQYAIACVAEPLPSPRLSFAASWHTNSVEKAIRMAHKKQYRSFGFCMTKDSNNHTQGLFLSRFLRYNFSLPKEKQIPPLLSDPGLYHIDKMQLKKWFLKYQPEAIISSGDQAYQILKSLGFRIPQDVGYIDLTIAFPNDKMTGIFELPRIVGERAADLVIEQIQLNQIGLPEYPKTIYVEGKWNEGSTLPRK